MSKRKNLLREEMERSRLGNASYIYISNERMEELLNDEEPKKYYQYRMSLGIQLYIIPSSRTVFFVDEDKYYILLDKKEATSSDWECLKRIDEIMTDELKAHLDSISKRAEELRNQALQLGKTNE
jgi:hypothetical protein